MKKLFYVMFVLAAFALPVAVSAHDQDAQKQSVRRFRRWTRILDSKDVKKQNSARIGGFGSNSVNCGLGCQVSTQSIPA